MRSIILVLGIIYTGLTFGQTPLEMDSTGNVVYHAEFSAEKGKELKAEDIFTRFINLNFKGRGNAIFFKNPATHYFAAKCYFKTTELHPFPSSGLCNFIWLFCIKEDKIRIYLYNIYWYGDEPWQGTFAVFPRLMPAEWINDYRSDYKEVSNASEKIDSQMKGYIKAFKESLSLIDKE